MQLQHSEMQYKHSTGLVTLVSTFMWITDSLECSGLLVKILLWCWLSMVSRFLQGTSTACRWISAPPSAGDNPHPRSFLQGLQDNLYSNACSIPTFYFSTALCVCRAVLLIFLFLSRSCSFSLFLKQGVAEVLPLSLFNSALASDGSILKLAETGSV